MAPSRTRDDHLCRLGQQFAYQMKSIEAEHRPQTREVPPVGGLLAVAEQRAVEVDRVEQIRIGARWGAQ